MKTKHITAPLLAAQLLIAAALPMAHAQHDASNRTEVASSALGPQVTQAQLTPVTCPSEQT